MRAKFDKRQTLRQSPGDSYQLLHRKIQYLNHLKTVLSTTQSLRGRFFITDFSRRASWLGVEKFNHRRPAYALHTPAAFAFPSHPDEIPGHFGIQNSNHCNCCSIGPLSTQRRSGQCWGGGGQPVCGGSLLRLGSALPSSQ